VIHKVKSRLLGGNIRLRRPFRMRELGPLPKGWKTTGPDFVGIASGSAGTTWWYQLLLDHPAVRPNRLGIKELCYFYHFDYRGVDADAMSTYRQAFASPEGCLCGEWSPGYLTYPLAAAYLSKAAPRAKLLAIVRNPIDRTRSALNRMLADHSRSTTLLPRFLTVMNTSLLSGPFHQLLRYFDRSQLLVLQYERCVSNPLQEIAKTYRFVGLDDVHVPKHLATRVNRRKPILAPLRPAERQVLAEYFAEDVAGLSALLPEIDLSLWPEFSPERGAAYDRFAGSTAMDGGVAG